MTKDGQVTSYTLTWELDSTGTTYSIDVLIPYKGLISTTEAMEMLRDGLQQRGTKKVTLTEHVNITLDRTL